MEHQRPLVNDRTPLSNRLTSLLKCYFPQVLAWFPGLRTELVCDFLLRWSTLESLRRVPRGTLLKFFQAHHSVRRDTLEKRLAAIKESVPLTTDRAVIDSSGVNGDGPGRAAEDHPGRHQTVCSGDCQTVCGPSRHCFVPGAAWGRRGLRAALAGHGWVANAIVGPRRRSPSVWQESPQSWSAVARVSGSAGVTSAPSSCASRFMNTRASQ